MEKEKRSETILVICMGLLVFYLIFQIKAILIIALIIGIIGVFSNYLADKIVWLWTSLAMVLGVINGKILLSLIFFVILTPISLFMQLLGKIPIKLKKPASDTMFSKRDHIYTSTDLEDIW